MPSLARAACCLALAVGLSACRRADPLPGFPRVILWAWEQPLDLRFIDPRDTGIAFLARSIEWRDGQVTSRPRLQPLQFPPGAFLIAVVRMESRGGPLPPAAQIADDVAGAARIANVRGMQLDFDARKSERRWYAQLICEVRARIGAQIPLTITALDSWCEGDPWIRDLAVADVVPMVFRMGPGERWSGRDFSIPLCRSSIGVSTDELPPSIPRGRRLFVFRPGGWTPAAYLGVNQLARRWQ